MACNPQQVHQAQEAYRKALLQHTIAGCNDTILHACASCGLSHPALEVAARSLRTLDALAYTDEETAQFNESHPLARLVRFSINVCGRLWHLHPELVWLRADTDAAADCDVDDGELPPLASRRVEQTVQPSLLLMRPITSVCACVR